MDNEQIKCDDVLSIEKGIAEGIGHILSLPVLNAVSTPDGVVSELKQFITAVDIMRELQLTHDDANDLVMQCSTTNNVVYKSDVYAKISEIATKMNPDMLPMLAHALKQYLVCRVMQCIGCSCIGLSEEILKELTGPLTTTTTTTNPPPPYKQYVRCIDTWISNTDERLKVVDKRLIFSDRNVPIFTLFLQEYSLEYAWIVLQIFMSYARLYIALKTSDPTKVPTNEEMLQQTQLRMGHPTDDLFSRELQD